MLLQILIVVILLAMLFPRVRRWLKTGLGMAFGVLVLFLAVVMLAQQQWW